jgi:hypothetical protein
MTPPAIHAGNPALHATLAVLVAGAILLAAHCAARAVRARTLVPMLALAGGVLALPIEPFWDVNVGFTFAADTHPVAFTAFGRHIPLYLAFIYPAFIGWGSFLGWGMIRRGASSRSLLLLCAWFFAGDAVIEIVGVRLHLWAYYGHQPLTIARWPILFGVLNGVIPLLGGALLAAIEKRVPGWRRPIALALAVPSAYAGIYAAAGWPTWAALNAHVPRAVDWAAGCASIAICALIAQSAAEAVGTREAAVEAQTTSPYDPVPIGR